MSNSINEKELSELFLETGMNHHHAYKASDGVDPEWALFYAGYLQARLWDRLGRVPTRSELIHLLVAADKAFQSTGRAQEEWPVFYANYLIEGFSAS